MITRFNFVALVFIFIQVIQIINYLVQHNTSLQIWLVDFFWPHTNYSGFGGVYHVESSSSWSHPVSSKVWQLGSSCGVTNSSLFSISMAEHVNHLVSSEQLLFVLRTHGHHGLHDRLCSRQVVMCRLHGGDLPCIWPSRSFAQAVDNSGLLSGHCSNAGHHLLRLMTNSS